MRTWKIIFAGIKSLALHKLRSVLSILGIVFGVAAVVAMLSIGEGARQEALEQIELLGTNNITIHALALTESQIMEAKKNLSSGLTATDASRLVEICPGISFIAPLKIINIESTYENRESLAPVVGTTPDYPAVRNVSVDKGRFITLLDIEENKRVCVLGADVAKTFFPVDSPLGSMIRLGSDWYNVIGVLQKKAVTRKSRATRDGQRATGSITPRNINNDIYIPLSVSVLVSPTRGSEIAVDEIGIRINEANKVQESANIIKTILTRLHNKVQDYEIIVPVELLRQSQSTQRIFNIVLGAIAGISLLTGGIGIMNIMLATVSERTKEIGIRAALGATRLDILFQFLIETLLLTVAGGIIGILLGIFGAYTINIYAEWRTVVSFTAIIIASLMSAIVGLLFGLLPAYKAARMDPIAALRFE
ncbi:MAG TPA: ABC transporter permease [Candidatus Brocadiia bacterium]|nr:ABC transporter permease [Planctomycetota bacterium]MDO8093217.1 ABC transporter permease [Candidatus Brocadiales bacterium]